MINDPGGVTCYLIISSKCENLSYTFNEDNLLVFRKDVFDFVEKIPHPQFVHGALDDVFGVFLQDHLRALDRVFIWARLEECIMKFHLVSVGDGRVEIGVE